MRACASEGSWRRGIAAIKNAESKSRTAPKDWACILEELPEKDNIQESMKNQVPITLDTEENAGLREAIRKRIKDGDVTVSQGCLGSGPGHWKPLLNEEKEEEVMLNTFAKVATGEVPTKIREIFMTGLLMAQDKDGKIVRPIIIPSFGLRGRRRSI